jgi:hypothetical protein
MDLAESNRCALRVTSHPVTDLTAKHPGSVWSGSAVDCFFPLQDNWAMYRNKDGKWIKDADHTHLVYCGYGTEGAVNFDQKKQTWVDHLGNGLFATSPTASQDCGSSTAPVRSTSRANPNTRAYISCEYGPGSHYTIDTRFPYRMTVTFDWNDHDKYLQAFTVNMTQAGRSVVLSRPVADNPADVNPDGGWGRDGKMGLVAQLWTSQNMEWLSGTMCQDSNNGTHLPEVNDVRFTISDIRINSKLIHFTTH